MRQGIFLPEPTLEDSLTVLAQSPCAIACINVCTRVKNPKHWQPHHCSWHTKMLHPLVGMGSTAGSCSGCNDPNFLKGLMNFYYKKNTNNLLKGKWVETEPNPRPYVHLLLPLHQGDPPRYFCSSWAKNWGNWIKNWAFWLVPKSLYTINWGQGRSANPISWSTMWFLYFVVVVVAVLLWSAFTISRQFP